LVLALAALILATCIAENPPELVAQSSNRTVDLVLEVDEGRAYDFGQLYLEGVEPYPGAGKALIRSWKPLDGRRFNPLVLQRWLFANHFDWKVAAQTSDSIRLASDPKTHMVNVTLTQWPT
jgi:hypothetical protein